MRYWSLAERSTKENGELRGVWGREYYVTTKNHAFTKRFMTQQCSSCREWGKGCVAGSPGGKSPKCSLLKSAGPACRTVCDSLKNFLHSDGQDLGLENQQESTLVHFIFGTSLTHRFRAGTGCGERRGLRPMVSSH